MKALVCLALVLVACREHEAPPPSSAAVTPPGSAAGLAPDAGIPAPQAELIDHLMRSAMTAPPPPSDGGRDKLFQDVAVDDLPLSIRIETVGDVASVIIPRGTKLPTSHTEVFSTAQQDQDRVEVHVLQGERPLVSQNRSLGKFQLFGIPPAPRGIPQIEVTFTIDKRGVLTVAARDRATNRTQQIKIEGALRNALDKTAIDALLAEARAAKTDDDILVVWNTARDQLQTMTYADRTLIQDVGGKLSAATRMRVEREIKTAEAFLALNTKPGDVKPLLAAKDALANVMHEASIELYRNAR